MTSNSAGLDLQATVDRFCALEQRAANISSSELYHVALSHLHEICRTDESGLALLVDVTQPRIEP